MPSINNQALALLSFLTLAFSSPIANPQTNNAVPQKFDTTAMAQTAALDASQKAAADPSASSLVNGLLAAVGMAPVINLPVSALSGTLTGFEQALATTLMVDTTEATQTCAEMMVIFARGTTEPGNMGLVTGPPFIAALEGMMGTGAVSAQGVEYGASIEGFLQGGDAEGSANMASMIQATAQNCPNAKIVMSGYSQGCQLVHNAAAQLPAATMAKVNSVVMFGDPNDGQAVVGADASKVMVVCHATDNICDHGDLILVEHLTYSRDADAAASFAVAQAKA